MIENSDNEITAVIRAKSIQELITKLQEILGSYNEIQPTKQKEIKQVFSQEIMTLYPDYENKQHSAAILTILYERHVGKANATWSEELAKEMKMRFPSLFEGKSIGEISKGNAISGTKLSEQGLIKTFTETENGEKYRMYYVETGGA